MNRDDLMFKYMGSLEIVRRCIRCNSSVADVIMLDNIPVCDYCRWFQLEEVKELIKEIKKAEFQHKIVVFSGRDDEHN